MGFFKFRGITVYTSSAHKTFKNDTGPCGYDKYRYFLRISNSKVVPQLYIKQNLPRYHLYTYTGGIGKIVNKQRIVCDRLPGSNYKCLEILHLKTRDYTIWARKKTKSLISLC